MVIYETPDFLTYTSHAQGSIRTTFLDKDMRIARGAAANGLGGFKTLLDLCISGGVGLR